MPNLNEIMIVSKEKNISYSQDCCDEFAKALSGIRSKVQTISLNVNNFNSNKMGPFLTTLNQIS